MITTMLVLLAALMVIGIFIVLGIILLALGPLGLILALVAPFVVIDVLIVKLIRKRTKTTEKEE